MRTRSFAEQYGDYLRALRDSRGLTLREVEARSGVNNGYLSLVEQGKREVPSLRLIQRLAGVYGASVVEMLRVAGEMLKGEVPANRATPTSPDERFIVEQYRRVSEEDKRTAARMLAAMIQTARRQREPTVVRAFEEAKRRTLRRRRARSA
jgi:transcriptional regulator with XRE-family HTH domain